MTVYISNPYRRMYALRNAMDRMLEDSFSETKSDTREMNLAVDVTSDDDGYTIKAYVPGLDAEGLEIEILNDTVSIRGEFKVPKDEKAKYLTNELTTGKFNRTVTLPTVVDAAKAEASIKNGVLELRVSKAEEHRPKTIKVSVA